MSAPKPRTCLVTSEEARELAPFGKRFELEVQSQATPNREIILVIRALIMGDEGLAELFTRFRKESLTVDWLRDMLATRVAVRLNGAEFEDVLDACQYLADEYHQLHEGYFLVSTETGKVVLVVTDDDLYDPGFLARHSGGTAQALKRLNPRLETAFVLQRHEQEREQDLLATLRERAVQTDLLREEGDSRLRIATRAGRTAIARDLAGDDAWELLRRASGTTGMFLRHVDLVESAPVGDPWVALEGVACFRSTLSVQDVLTANLSYNRLGTLRGAAPQGWVRDIARRMCSLIHETRSTVPLHMDDIDDELVASQELWVADPDVHAVMRRLKGNVVPVEGVTAVGLSGKVGLLEVAHEFLVETRESSGSWEVVANLTYRLSVDPRKIRPLPLVGIERATSLELR